MVPIHQNTTLQKLIQYIKQGADDQVKRVLENESNIKTHKNMISLAKAAVDAGKKNIIVTLLKHGLNVNVALDITVNSGKDDFIELMLDQGADVNEGLYFAVKANNKDAITFLLERGANINTSQRNGNTPLHTAVMKKCDTDFVKHLIENGAKNCIQNKKNKTAVDLVRNLFEKENDIIVKDKLEKIIVLVGSDQNVFDCLGGGPKVLSGFSYQIKYLTLYAIINTKLTTSSKYQFELSTEVKNLVPFDDIYLRKTQDEQTSCEFVQVKQGRIEPFKFFTLFGTENNVKEYIKGNESIVKMFIKFNEIKENPLYQNTSRKFIYCTNSNFTTDPSPCLKHVKRVNYEFLCGLKHEQWIIDPYFIFIEIRHILMNLLVKSPYFKTLQKKTKNKLKNQIKLLNNLMRIQSLNQYINDEFWAIKTIAIIGIRAIEKYLKYLRTCKRKIENAIDTENVKKNLPAEFELLFTNDLTLLINRAVSKINEMFKSFTIDKEFFLYFSKFDDDIIKDKIGNFVKHFCIYTDCPTSDELDDIITKEISEEFEFNIPILISAHCLQYFNTWISNFKNEKGRVFNDKEGKELFHDIKTQIFNAFNKSYIEELQRTELHFKQNNDQVMYFLNKEKNYKILHLVTQHTSLHAINILQTVKNVKEQSTDLDYLNDIICSSLEQVIKSDAYLKNVLDVLTSQDNSDLFILDCLEGIEQQKVSIVFDYLKHVIKARRKLTTFQDLIIQSRKYVSNKSVQFNKNNSNITEYVITMSAAGSLLFFYIFLLFCVSDMFNIFEMFKGDHNILKSVMKTFF